MSLLFSPAEHRLRAGWRLLVHLALLVVLYFSVAIFLAPFQAIFNLDESFTALFLFNTIIALIAVTASIFLARRRFDKRTFTSLGLAWNRRAVRDLLAGIGITGLIMALIYAAEAALGWLRFEAFAWQSETPGAIAGSLLLYLVIYIAGGLAGRAALPWLLAAEPVRGAGHRLGRADLLLCICAAACL